MVSNAQKTPFAESLHRFGDIKVQDWQSRLPQSMPATVVSIMGALVKVSIDGNWTPFSIPQVLVPKFESAYGRAPTQIGDKGAIIGINYYIGGQSGQGGGTANLYPRANLTNAIWLPISQKSFGTVDPNAYTLQGSNGVVLRDTTNAASLTLTPTGIAMKIGGVTFTFNAAGITTSGLGTSMALSGAGLDIEGGTLTNNSVNVGSTHVHNGVMSGGSDTGPPM